MTRLGIGKPRTDARTVTRRGFVAGLSAGSLTLAFKLASAQETAQLVADDDADLSFQPDLFVSIAPDGGVTIVAHRSEMGTGIRTILPMIVADELGADWDRVTIQQATGDSRLGSQNTDGSRSVRRFYDRMRVAGATARSMLERAAAVNWNVSPSECKAQDHKVRHATSGKEIGFGQLVKLATGLPVPNEADLKFRSPDERRYIGKDVPISDQDDIVTGRAIYGIDVRRPNQLFAVVARPPVFGGRVRRFDANAARAVAGVEDVVEVPRFEGPPIYQPLGGVAVIANSTWAAIQGREALSIEWDHGPHANYDSEEFLQKLNQTSRAKGKVIRSVGDVDRAFADATIDSTHVADYLVPHGVHAPMEPPCALCDVKTDANSGNVISCEAWAPTQDPQAAQDQLAEMLGIDKQVITVHVTLLGTGLGRKSKPDFIAEAAFISKAVGRPVHVTWTREDDIQNGYYATTAAVHMRAAVNEEGMPTAWLQRSTFPTIMSLWDPTDRHGAEFEMSQGFTDVPYSVPNLRVENGGADAHLRIGWMRSVGHIYHAFAVCSFPDELAHRAGRDPYNYLLELLGPDRHLSMEGVEYANRGEPLERYPIDIGRLRHVTQRAAALAGWGKRLPGGSGLGIACQRSFLSYCAHVVEVNVTKKGEVSIPRVCAVIDAGLVIHPDRVKAQMEGAAVFATGLARDGEITVKKGRVQQSNFDDYDVARIDNSPREIVVEIVRNEEPPGGVGEVGVPTFAPALCNAIFAATGKRIRRLPISHFDLSWA